MMDLLCEVVKAVNYFHKKTPPLIFNRVPNRNLGNFYEKNEFQKFTGNSLQISKIRPFSQNILTRKLTGALYLPPLLYFAKQVRPRTRCVPYFLSYRISREFTDSCPETTIFILNSENMELIFFVAELLTCNSRQ